MSNLAKKEHFNDKQKVTIEYIASKPGITNQELAALIKVNPKTIAIWRNNPKFIDAIYDRFMEVTGKELPALVLALIEEGKQGNVKAIELALKHFGKFQDSVTIKIESPFMQHLKIADVEEEEIVEDVAIDIGHSFEVKDQDKLPPLPERDPLNDTPNAVARRQNKALRDAELKSKRTYADNKKRKAANERKKIRTRAKKVGLKILPPGKPSPEARRKWLDELHKRETELLK